MTLGILNYGNDGLLLIMAHAGFISSTVTQWPENLEWGVGMYYYAGVTQPLQMRLRVTQDIPLNPNPEP